MPFYSQYADPDNQSVGRLLYWLEEFGVPLSILDNLELYNEIDERGPGPSFVLRPKFGERFAYVNWDWDTPIFYFVNPEWEKKQSELASIVEKREIIFAAQNKIERLVEQMREVIPEAGRQLDLIKETTRLLHLPPLEKSDG